MGVPAERDRRAALVTGGSGGLGREIAASLAREGFDVCLGYRTNGELAARVAADIEARFGVQAFAVQADVRDAAAAEALARAPHDRWGRLDVLVNAAGVTVRQRVLDVTEEALREIFEVNVIGLFLVCQAAARRMVEQRSGRIVNISSIASHYALGDRSVYEASKAAVDRLTRSFAYELGPFGVTVNAVAPGLIETVMTLRAGRADFERRVKDIPLGRIGRADEVADVVTYLAVHAPGYITGAVLPYDGGRITH
jgi:3-oxoacyl-[acyl-carrier protein] reductase